MHVVTLCFIFIFPKIFSNFPLYFFFAMLLKSSLLNFHISVSFLIFLLLQISSLIPLRLKKTQIISILLNLIRFILWPSMWYIMKTVLCALEKNVYLLLLCGMFCVNLVGPLVWNIVQVCCFLIDFMSELSIPYLVFWSLSILLFCCLFLSSDLSMFTLYI